MSPSLTMCSIIFESKCSHFSSHLQRPKTQWNQPVIKMCETANFPFKWHRICSIFCAIIKNICKLSKKFWLFFDMNSLEIPISFNCVRCVQPTVLFAGQSRRKSRSISLFLHILQYISNYMVWNCTLVDIIYFLVFEQQKKCASIFKREKKRNEMKQSPIQRKNRSE